MSPPTKQTTQSNAPNRLLVAIITITCFAAAALIRQFDLVDRSNTLLVAGLVRVGICMGALWFALPSRRRAAAWANLSPWVIVGLAVAAFLLPRFKFSIPILIGMLIFGAFVRPRKKRHVAPKRPPEKRLP